MLVDRVLAGSSKPAYYLLVKGMLDYRDEKYDSAVEALTLARRKFVPLLAAPNADDFSFTDTEAAITFFLAMAEYRRSNIQAAREALAQARWRLATQVPDETSISWKVGDPDWLIAKIAAPQSAKPLVHLY